MDKILLDLDFVSCSHQPRKGKLGIWNRWQVGCLSLCVARVIKPVTGVQGVTHLQCIEFVGLVIQSKLMSRGAKYKHVTLCLNILFRYIYFTLESIFLTTHLHGLDLQTLVFPIGGKHCQWFSVFSSWFEWPWSCSCLMVLFWRSSKVESNTFFNLGFAEVLISNVYWLGPDRDLVLTCSCSWFQLGLDLVLTCSCSCSWFWHGLVLDLCLSCLGLDHAMVLILSWSLSWCDLHLVLISTWPWHVLDLVFVTI